MFLKKKQLEEIRNSKEQEAIRDIKLAFGTIHGMNSQVVKVFGQSMLLFEIKEFSLVITTCNASDDKNVERMCVKVEDFLVEPEYRGQGIGTYVIQILKDICALNDCTLGLWAEKDKVSWYEKLGFKFIEKKRDYWMEYTPEGEGENNG